jgi:hypothetical protein
MVVLDHTNRGDSTVKLTAEQYEQLLKPLNSTRVAQRSQAGRSLSYLEAWDVKAHLIRIFGFGGWSADVLGAELAFEEQNEKKQWHVGYRVVMRLTLHGDEFAQDPTYTEAAVGSATLPQRGEAHDMAIKTAESDALKRAAINLGTQFGLSLYDNGSTRDVVRGTLRPPDGWGDTTTAPVPAAASTPPVSAYAEATVATDEDMLRAIWDTCEANGWLDMAPEGYELTMKRVINDRLAELREGKDA